LSEASVLPPPNPIAPSPSPGDFTPPGSISIAPPILPSISTVLNPLGRGDIPFFCKDFTVDVSGTSLPPSLIPGTEESFGFGMVTGTFSIQEEIPQLTRTRGCSLRIFPFNCALIPCIDDASECGGVVQSAFNEANKKELIYYTKDKIELKYEIRGKARLGKMVVIPLESISIANAMVWVAYIRSDEGKHCVNWPLTIAPTNVRGEGRTASPGHYMIELSCESDEGQCKDVIWVTVYDVDKIRRIYAHWINHFRTQGYGKKGVVLGEMSWEFPFMRALHWMSDRLATKYYNDLVGGSGLARREFMDPCWAIRVSQRMAEYMDEGLRAGAAEGWKEWRNRGEVYNTDLANSDNPADWSRAAQVVKGLKSLRHAMYLEQVDGLSEGLIAAGKNNCCEQEFRTWARTAREVAGMLDEDIVLAAEGHHEVLEPNKRWSFPSLSILELAPHFYKLAKEKARAKGWSCQ
jgi:hypothetical protein